MNPEDPCPHFHIGPSLEADSSQQIPLNKEKFKVTPSISPSFHQKIEEQTFSPTHLSSPERKPWHFNIKNQVKTFKKKKKKKNCVRKMIFFTHNLSS